MSRSPSAAARGSSSGTSAVPMTHPVIVRVPIGTSTRAPAAGVSMPSGMRYVSRSSCGTGTATDARRIMAGYRSPSPSSPRSSARTFFMSSQTSRLRSGLRSRYAGWNVGIRRASP